jgi:light-regulated signal transduction histidine kinase (bacteriophytochrome)
MRKSQLYSIAFGFSLLVLLFFSLLLYNSINSLNEYSFWVERSHTVMFNLQRLQSYMKDTETSQRGFLLTKDSSFLQPLMESRTDIPQVLDTLLVLSRYNAKQYEKMKALKSAVSQTLNWIAETLPKRVYDEKALSTRLKRGQLAMNNFRTLVKDVELEELALLESRANNKKIYERITPNYFKVIFSITTIIAFISFILLLQELRQRLESQNLLETKFHALNQSNAELQQIAHVTSHDLQEPLRKIRTFSDVLISKYGDSMKSDGQLIIDRIGQNTFRMQQLIADLSSFTSLVISEGKMSMVDLNKIVLEVQQDLSEQIVSKKSKINVSTLPVLRGYPHQLHILFRELLDNALKFSQEGLDSAITITANQVRGDQLETKNRKFESRNFIVINIYDNGIGFEKEYADKIFILFQRLHPQDSPYPGKGIGLAICQRIMSNHNGFATASAEVDNGATFHLYFPLS